MAHPPQVDFNADSAPVSCEDNCMDTGRTWSCVPLPSRDLRRLVEKFHRIASTSASLRLAGHPITHRASPGIPYSNLLLVVSGFAPLAPSKRAFCQTNCLLRAGNNTQELRAIAPPGVLLGRGARRNRRVALHAREQINAARHFVNVCRVVDYQLTHLGRYQLRSTCLFAAYNR